MAQIANTAQDLIRGVFVEHKIREDENSSKTPRNLLGSCWSLNGTSVSENKISSTCTAIAVYPNRYYSVEGDTTTKHIFANGQLIATIEGNGQATSTYYVHTDHLTGSNVISNSEGVLVQVVDYYPYGDLRINEKYGSFDEQRKFTGHMYDDDTDLTYMGARYYPGATGRFLSVDPLYRDIGLNRKVFKQKYNKDLYAILSNPQELNSYTYALNNPLLFVDPNGQTSWGALIFHPLSTLSQITFWAGVSEGYFRSQGSSISANLLERSLTINPTGISITENNQYSNIVDEIKSHSDYQSYVGDLIEQAEAAGETTIHNRKEHTKGITFSSGDLGTSIHGTKSTFVTGHQNTDGTWSLRVNIYDIYDYDFATIQKYQNDPKTAFMVGLAASSQNRGVISKYSINISFSDEREE